MNAKRIYRLYRDLGLQLRNKVAKRRVKAKLRDDRRPAQRANETWAMDFLHDQLATGRKIRVLTIVDTFTRYAPAILVAKRLEKGRFVWPQTQAGVVSLTAAQLSMLVEGIDWRMPAWTARPQAAV